MLNERQESTLRNLLIFAKGKENMINKYDLFYKNHQYKWVARTEFHASPQCRQLADDVQKINLFSEHVIVSTTHGLYVADSQEAWEVLEKQNKADGEKIQRRKHKQKKIRLNNQTKGDV